MKTMISWLIEDSSHGNGPNLVGVAYRNDHSPMLVDEAANMLPEIRGCSRRNAKVPEYAGQGPHSAFHTLDGGR